MMSRSSGGREEKRSIILGEGATSGVGGGSKESSWMSETTKEESAF